jgi:hypothetical protein
VHFSEVRLEECLLELRELRDRLRDSSSKLEAAERVLKYYEIQPGFIGMEAKAYFEQFKTPEVSRQT